jgi:hypothetical protein
MRFVNSEHFCHPVLTKPAGIDPKFQIRIDVTMNCHCNLTQLSFWHGRRTLVKAASLAELKPSNQGAKTSRLSCVNILLHLPAKLQMQPTEL